MADPLNLEGLRGLIDDDVCLVEATCTTGFEAVAAEEIQEVLGCEGKVHRGRVLFDVEPSNIKQCLKLRTVNNLYVLVGHTHKFSYGESSVEQLVSLADFADNCTWNKSLKVWKNVMEFKGPVFAEEINKKLKSEEEGRKDDENPKGDVESSPTFRCTCYRTGTNHKFKSTEAQFDVGGRLHDKFNWIPRMKEYDLEVVINCDVDQVYVSISLTNKSLFNRTISHFGYLTLKPVISACLVRLAKVEPGEIVLDPMCGGGSIPLEGSQLNIGAYFLGAEIDPKGIERCRNNMMDITTLHNLKSGPLMDCLEWDALHPGFRDHCVDVIVSDLPFGRRSGSKADNRALYPKTMLAMARLVKPDTGRAILLTQDKTSMFKCYAQIQKYWKMNKYFGINIGGLKGIVFQFKRTSEVKT